MKFNKKYISLYSQERLSEYNDIKEHENNFDLIQEITGKIGRIEVILRNKIDTILTQGRNEKWLIGEEIRIEKDKIKITNEMFIDEYFIIKDTKYKKSQIISKQTLGFWFRLAKQRKIFDKIFSKELLKNLDLKQFYNENKNKIKKNKLVNHEKGEILFGLFVILRNRAFHWENLYKIRNNKPRLQTAIKDKIIISLHYEKIHLFLNIILEYLKKGNFNKTRSGEQSPLESKKILL